MFFKPKRIRRLEEDLAHYMAISIQYKNEIEISKATIDMLTEALNKNEEEKKKILGAKGGLKKQVNKQSKIIKELEQKVKELSSNAYLRVPLKPQRIPKAAPMKIKSSAKTSNIARKHKMEIENELN